jgi:hypothetical protein
VFDARDAIAIEKRGHVTALVPVAVRAFAYFVDEECVAGGEDNGDWLWLIFSRRFLVLRVNTRTAQYQNK